MANVYYFSDTGDAYDSSQGCDKIKNGDILVSRQDKVVGILVEAWPVAITQERGHFHGVGDAWDWSHVEATRGGAVFNFASNFAQASEIARQLRDELLATDASWEKVLGETHIALYGAESVS